MSEIIKKDENVKLMIIGDGYLKDKIEQKINELHLETNIVLLNGKSDVFRYYSAFDCFVLPSKYEGLGIVNIEAQVSGLDVIVSNKVPLEAKVTENIKYLDLNIGAEKWACEILKLKGKQRNKISKKIYDSGYDIKKEAQKLEKLYLDLLLENNRSEK